MGISKLTKIKVYLEHLENDKLQEIHDGLCLNMYNMENWKNLAVKDVNLVKERLTDECVADEDVCDLILIIMHYVDIDYGVKLCGFICIYYIQYQDYGHKE